MLFISEYYPQINNRTKLTHTYQTLFLKISISDEVFFRKCTQLLVPFDAVTSEMDVKVTM